jgi:hypothetical protein
MDIVSTFVPSSTKKEIHYLVRCFFYRKNTTKSMICCLYIFIIRFKLVGIRKKKTFFDYI